MEIVGVVIIVILIAAGVVALGTVLFTGWVLVRALALTGRAVGWVVGLPAAAAGARPQRQLPGPAGLRCPRPRCHADNVPAAKFCRRCGTSMAGDGLVMRPRRAVGRAAMW